MDYTRKLPAARGAGKAAQGRAIIRFLRGARVGTFAGNAFFLPSRPAEDALSAADCRHLLHGFGRSLWHRGHSRRSRISEGHPHPADLAAGVVPAYRADDRRTGQRHSRRGRFLHLGAARAGSLLGLPGELAFALGQHLRHGPLSGHLRSLPGQILACAHRRLVWLRLAAGGGGGLLRVEPASARRQWARTRWGCLRCCWRPLRSSWFSASGMG